LIASEPWLDRRIFNESEMAHSSACMLSCAQKVLDTADIVRDAIYRQLTLRGDANLPSFIDLPHPQS